MTSGADLFGPRIVDHSPTTIPTDDGPLNEIVLEFDEPIDLNTFDVSDVGLKDPQGQVIDVAQVSVVPGTDDRRFRLDFPAQTIRGDYRLTVGPEISDIAGNAMNQDGDFFNGELNGQDGFRATIGYSADALVIPAGAGELFVEDFEDWAPVPSYWSLASVESGAISAVASGSPHGGLQHLMFTPSVQSRDQSATLALDLSNHVGATELYLDFWARRNISTTSSNELLVEISGDGQAWNTMLSTDPPTEYAKFALDIDQFLSDNGIALDDDVYIRLRHNGTNASYSANIDDLRLFVGDPEGPALQLEIDERSISEEGAVTSSIATVTRVIAADVSAPLVVQLTNSDASEVVIPDFVVIPAGATATTFAISAVDDMTRDGSQGVIIRAYAAGFFHASDVVFVEDAAGPLLTLTLDNTVLSEAIGGTAAMATVTRSGDLSSALLVNIANSDSSEIWTPPSVTIPANAATAQFPVEVVNDPDVDGNASPRISVSAADYSLISDVATVQVLDDDTADRRTLGGRFAGTLPKDTYHVLGTLTIESGKTLNVAPGSTLRSSPGAGFTVAGTLVADGADGSEIIFTSELAEPAPGDWLGIRHQSADATRTILDHVVIEFAQTGLSVLPNASTSGLTLSNSRVASSSANGIQVTPGTSSISDPNAVVIEHNIIRQNGQNGISLSAFASGCSGETNNASVRNNDISYNAGAGVYMVGAGSSSFGCVPFSRTGVVTATVDSNVIHHNQGDGIFGAANDGYFANGSLRSLIQNNLVWANVGNGVRLAGDDFPSPTIRNNTIVDNDLAGVLHVPGDPIIRNNVIVTNQGGIQATETTTPPTGQITHNLLYSNSENTFLNYPASFGEVTTANGNGSPSDFEFNIFLDPLFVAADDFHLLPSSPAVNAGTDQGAPMLDFDGDVRAPLIDAIDIGFDEFTRLAGDFDGNGVVDGGDLGAWRGGFGMTAGATAQNGDADSDGDVDGGDFLAWQRRLGQGIASGHAGSEMPQAAAALIGEYDVANALARSAMTVLAARDYTSAAVADDVFAQWGEHHRPSRFAVDDSHASRIAANERRTLPPIFGREGYRPALPPRLVASENVSDRRGALFLAEELEVDALHGAVNGDD
jgi:hypothetical protein